VSICFAGKVALEHKIFSSLGLAPSVKNPNSPPPPKDGKVIKNLLFLAKPSLVLAKAFNSSTLLAIYCLP
jgi:hypothetical protein